MPRKPRIEENTPLPSSSATLTRAYREGMCTRSVVAAGEDQDAYDRLLQDLRDQFQPRNPGEEHLVQQAADATWRSGRLKGIESALLGADEVDTHELDLISRWQVRMESSYFKAYNELKRLLKLRDEANTQADSEPSQPIEECVYWWDPVTNKRQQIAGPPQEYDPAREIGPHKNNIPYSDPPRNTRLRVKP